MSLPSTPHCDKAGCMFTLFRVQLSMNSSHDVTDLFHCEFKWKRESESSLTSPRLLKTRVVWLCFPPIFLIHSRRSVLLILLGHSCWSAELSELLRVRRCSVTPFGRRQIHELQNNTWYYQYDFRINTRPSFYPQHSFSAHAREAHNAPCPSWKETPRLLRSQLISSPLGLLWLSCLGISKESRIHWLRCTSLLF